MLQRVIFEIIRIHFRYADNPSELCSSVVTRIAVLKMTVMIIK